MTNTWTMAKVLTRQRFKTAVNTFIVTIVAAVITVILVYLAGSPKLSPQFIYSMLSPYVYLAPSICLFGSRLNRNIPGLIIIIVPFRSQI